jgi:nitrile hydratase subunit alpha
MPHEHEHDHERSHLSEMELRVRALESVLRQKGYIDPAALDLLIESYEKKIGPPKWGQSCSQGVGGSGV